MASTQADGTDAAGAAGGSTESITGTIRGLATRANPAFATGVVVVPLALLAYAVTLGSLQFHTYVHVMAGVLWTGIDLFMAAALGPAVGGLEVDERAAFFSRLTPKTSFLLPSLAAVTIGSGITLALRFAGLFSHAHVWLAIFTFVALVPTMLLIGREFDAYGDWRWRAWFAVVLAVSVGYLAVTLPDFGWTEPVFVAALGVVAVLNILGFGVLMPGEVRMYKEMTSENPDSQVIADVGMRNAKLGGIQGVFQLLVIATMVLIRWRQLTWSAVF
jgi:hypothetical protein